MKTLQILSLACALGAASILPAHAQESLVTLRIDSGTVMTSQGSEFATAGNGATLEPGSRVMLGDNSAATLVYGNGCTRPLKSGGVYTVTPSCTPVATYPAEAAAGIELDSVLVIAGLAAAGAVGLGSRDDTDAPPPPVSR
ncbi:MAG TPA: hypothetical protein VLK29_07840 [Luteimonas sp.]|nr:hypothetical protein [Luteimonas sp.]